MLADRRGRPRHRSPSAAVVANTIARVLTDHTSRWAESYSRSRSRSNHAPSRSPSVRSDRSMRDQSRSRSRSNSLRRPHRVYTPISRAKFTKYGLPAQYQKVAKPVYGNAHKPKGTIVKFRRKSAKVKNFRYKYNQGFRITQYVMNPKVSFIPSTGQIKTRDSVIVEGSKANHYKLMVWNASPVVTYSDNKLGNQQQDPDQNWVFSSNDDNTNLIYGYFDRRDVDGDGTPTPEQVGIASNRNVITVSGIPFSGNSQKYVIPNMVQKAVNVNLHIELLSSLEQPVEVFFKIVRRTKPSKPNGDLTDKGTDDIVQAQYWEDTTKTICNNHITDKEMYQTIFLYKKTFTASSFSKGIKQFQIKKLVKCMYNRTSSYMHTDITNRTNIGEAILPNLDQHQDAIANQLWCVLGIRQLDDNYVQLVQKNISGSNDISNITLANKYNVSPVKDDENFFRIRGYVTSVFAARDIERNSTLHASSITDLHTRLTALEASTATHTDSTGQHQHGDLTGTWKKADNSIWYVVTAASSGSYDYTAVRTYADGTPSISYEWTDDGNIIHQNKTSTGSQHHYNIDSAGTKIWSSDGQEYFKQ